MSAKTILNRGHHTLRRWVTPRSQSGAQSGLAGHWQAPPRNWSEVGDLDTRQLRDIGFAEALAPATIGQLHRDLCVHRPSINASPYFGFGAGL